MINEREGTGASGYGGAAAGKNDTQTDDLVMLLAISEVRRGRLKMDSTGALRQC